MYRGCIEFGGVNEMDISLEEKLKVHFEYVLSTCIDNMINGRIHSFYADQEECYSILRMLYRCGVLSEQLYHDAFECVSCIR